MSKQHIMQDRLIETLNAIECNSFLHPPSVPTIELICNGRMTMQDAPRIARLQAASFVELEISLCVVGGGLGCTRIIVTVDCDDPAETRRLLNELFLNDWFAKAAIEARFDVLYCREPYLHKTLASGRILGQVPDDSVLGFISYAHEDENHCQNLRKHLSVLEKQKLLRLWHDRELVAGSSWAQDIEHQLAAAKLFLLLVSSDFMSSNYCYNIEMEYALRRHGANKARVTPIIVRPVDWEESPLGILQATPKDGKAVTLWPNMDEAWTDVTKQLRRTIRQLRKI